MPKDHWFKYPEICIPLAYKQVWMFDKVAGGVFIATRGLGSGEWWQGSERVWAPSHWMPYSAPLPPSEE